MGCAVGCSPLLFYKDLLRRNLFFDRGANFNEYQVLKYVKKTIFAFDEVLFDGDECVNRINRTMKRKFTTLVAGIMLFAVSGALFAQRAGGGRPVDPTGYKDTYKGYFTVGVVCEHLIREL